MGSFAGPGHSRAPRPGPGRGLRGRAHHAPSATGALEDVCHAVDEDLLGLVGSLTPLPDQRGVVVAVGEEVRGIDLFDKPETLTTYWPGIATGPASLLARPRAVAEQAHRPQPLDPLSGTGMAEMDPATGSSAASRRPAASR